MNVLTTIINLFGGLGLFLYGMNMMGDGLENAAGDKLKSVFDKITSNPVKGVLTGAIVTAIIQSSSATTVMVVGFVNAGLMNLYQAAAVIMGANIGTTITAQLITFNFDAIATLFLAIGAMVVLFSKNKRTKQIGNIVLGFGILFLGLDLMKIAMSPLADSPFFSELIIKLQGRVFLGVLLGMVMTAVIQSSSASTGILVALAATGALPITVAIPILLGNNIGTCVTALISSIGTSKTAKKAAVIHLLFNVIGVALFIPFIGKLGVIVQDITPGMTSEAVKRQIANAHTIFNVLNTLILIWFIKPLVALVNKLIPGEDEKEAMGVKYIDERLLETPVIALGQTKNELIRMANKSKENVQLAMKAFKECDEKALNSVYENEKLINILEQDITRFLIKLANTELGEEQKNIVAAMFHVVNDVERIGDHAENIADLAAEKITKNVKFSEDAIDELMSMFNYTINSLEMSIDCFKEYDKEKALTVREFEEKIDTLEKDLRSSHIKRLNAGVCDAIVGAIFLDTISNFERIGDHAVNIAEIIAETPYNI